MSNGHAPARRDVSGWPNRIAFVIALLHAQPTGPRRFPLPIDSRVRGTLNFETIFVSKA